MKTVAWIACLPFLLAGLTMCGTDNSSQGNGGPSSGSGGTSGSSSGHSSSGASSGSSGSGTSSGGSSGSSNGGSGSSGSSSGGSSGSSSGSSSGLSSGSSSGGSSGAAGASVLMHHAHPNRDGFFVDAKLTKAAAATMHNDMNFKAMFNGAAFATPLFVAAGQVPALNGGKGTVFLATATNDVYAFDEMTGNAVWHVTVGAPASGPGVGCGNISPQGVIGTPAIDLAAGLIVMDGGTGGGGLSDHIVYGLDLTTGMTKWSLPLGGTTDSKGNTFNASQHLQRPAALIVNGYAYFGFSGNIGDCGNYNGWVIGVSLDGTASKSRGWRTDDSHSGIWGPGGPSSDGNAIYVATGNGSGPSSWMGSEGIIRLGLDLSFTGNAMDYYTPSNFAGLDGTDADISGSNPIVVDAMGMKLIVALGKDGNAYLIDRTNMGGVGGTLVGQKQVSNGPISNAAAWATIGGTTYVVANNNTVGGGSGCAMGGGDLFAIKLDMAAQGKMTEIWCADPGGATSPVITSSDGNNDAIVWIGSENGGSLHAFDLATGMPIANTTTIAGMEHFSPSIMVANGRIYAAGNNGQLNAFTP